MNLHQTKESKKYNLARKHSFLLLSICMTIALYVVHCTNILDTDTTNISSVVKRRQKESQTCFLPKLNPFNPNVKKYLRKPESFNCHKIYPHLFHTDLNSNLILNATLKATVYSNCCYHELFRANGTDDDAHVYSFYCEPIVNNITKIPRTVEFIAVFCFNKTSNKSEVHDMFGFVNLKTETEERCMLNSNLTESLNSTDENAKTQESVNVLLLGIDAVSHLNFIRTMAKTYSFIIKNLSAVSMQGFTSIGGNTLPAVMSALAGLSLEEGKNTCYGKNNYFDTCPLIWKDYSAVGYRTSYGEDAPNMAAFNYLLKGFANPPTDYYLRPLMNAHSLLGNHKSTNVQLCYGPQLAFNILMDYMKKTAHTFENKRKYFQFIWSNSISHDYLNNPKIGDEKLFETLKWLYDGNYLNNTILILMSDHGLRGGKYRRSFEGSIEMRMPYLFFIFPKWFSNKYPSAMRTIKNNSERLTTCFDLHQTLLDLINLNSITDEKISERSKKLELDLENINASNNTKRAISLFLPIPLKRNCTTAQIPTHFCTCSPMKMKPESIDPEIKSLVQLGEESVTFINKILLSHPECSVLKLDKVESARKAVANGESRTVSYIVNFITTPGNASFEVTALRIKTQNEWVISNEISRTNLYGNQSYCVNERNLKKFCFCL